MSLPIFSFNYSAPENLSQVADFLISLESEILETYPFVSDFGTGLSESHIITRASAFNVFNFESRCLELSNIKAFISSKARELLPTIPRDYDTNQLNDDQPSINAWININRPGEGFARHRHSNQPWSVMSGTFVVRDNVCTTRYELDDVTEDYLNNDGRLSFFQSNLFHQILENPSEQSRVAIGFDVFFNKKTINDLQLLMNVRDL